MRGGLLPAVQSAYQILGQMATLIYLAMYLIMFVTAIRLRYTKPLKTRPYRLAGGNLGMWAVGVIGLHFPPADLRRSRIKCSQVVVETSWESVLPGCAQW